MNARFGNPKNLLFALVVSGFLSLGMTAGESAENNSDGDDFIGITGLVINNTTSKVGNDFFDVFNASWKAVEGLNYTITITEKPDIIFGSQFWVQVDDYVVLSGRLNPRMQLIEEKAKEARKRVSLHLLERISVSRELEMY